MKNIIVVGLVACVSYAFGKKEGLRVGKKYLMEAIINHMDDTKNEDENE